MKARRLAKCSLRALARCTHLNCRRCLAAWSDVALGLVCAPLGPAFVPALGATAEAGAALIVADGSARQAARPVAKVMTATAAARTDATRAIRMRPSLCLGQGR